MLTKSFIFGACEFFYYFDVFRYVEIIENAMPEGSALGVQRRS